MYRDVVNIIYGLGIFGVFLFMFAVIVIIGIFTHCNLFAASKDSALIAAVVNQHAITERELDSRVDFAIATLNMPATEAARESMRHQVLRNLIVEKLQETAAEGIKVSDEELTASLENMAKDNGMTLEGLREKFKHMGVNVDTLKSRIRAQIIWSRLIRRMYQNQVRVTDSEVAKEIERIENEHNTDSYELAEIVLPIDDKEKAKSRQDAERLYAQLAKPGTDFRLVARQFGAQSGYVGWKNANRLDQSLAAVVKSMAVGRITRPIEDKNTFRIVKLLDKRMAGKGLYSNREIVTGAARIALPGETNEETMAALEDSIGRLKETKSCPELKKAAEGMSIEVSISEKQPFGALPEPLRVIFDNAAPGEAIGPFQDGNHANVLMICSIEEPEKEKLPTAQEVKESLEQREFGRHATRLLNRLMATARITIVDRNALPKKPIKNANRG